MDSSGGELSSSGSNPPPAPAALVHEDTLVLVIRAWDRVCADISRKGAAAAKRKRPYIPSRRALAAEAREMNMVMSRAAEALGIPTHRLQERIAAARREGLSIPEAVARSLRQ